MASPATSYGFRYDPMGFVKKGTSVPAALVRAQVFHAPQPGDEAIRHYTAVAGKLSSVAEMLPLFPMDDRLAARLKDMALCGRAMAALKAARAAEREGVQALKKVAAALEAEGGQASAEDKDGGP
jgi:hypothetical protein